MLRQLQTARDLVRARSAVYRDRKTGSRCAAVASRAGDPFRVRARSRVPSPARAVRGRALSGLSVGIDARALEKWAEELSARGMRNALRRAIDQASRAARRATIPVIAKDIGISAARIKAAVPKVKATTATNLSATWTIGKLRVGIMNVSGAKVSRYGGLTASTHRLTGGGSATLHIAKAFLVKTGSGERYVAYREGSARSPIKGVYAEHPATAMRQPKAAARKIWDKSANAELSVRLPREVQKQFYSERLSAATFDASD